MADLPTREGMHRRGTKKSGADWDVFTGWRRLLCYTQRAGVTKQVKAAYNKRDRLRARQQLRGDQP